MQNILITGGNGFVGSHLIDKIDKKYHIYIFDKARREAWWETNAKWLRGDLTSYNDVARAVDGIDGIVHLGAISRVNEAKNDPLRCMNINVMGTINILEAVRNSKNSPWIILGSTIEPPSNIYGMSKHISELCGERYVEDYGLRVLALKFSSIYGSLRDDKEKVISKWVSSAINNQDINIDNSKSRFDFIYIDDIVDGIILGMEYIKKADKGFFDAVPLCTGKATNLLDLSKLIVEGAHSKSEINVTDTYEEESYSSSPKKAEEVLGFKSKIDISEGIKKTIGKR